MPFDHLLHADSQRYSYYRRQTFRNGSNGQADRDHEHLDHRGDGLWKIKVARKPLGKEHDQFGTAHDTDQTHHGADDEGDATQSLAQLIQLDLKRSGFLLV